jgi:hypothetical protein
MPGESIEIKNYKSFVNNSSVDIQSRNIIFKYIIEVESEAVFKKLVEKYTIVEGSVTRKDTYLVSISEEKASQVKNEKGVESIEQRNGVIFYDSAISTFSLIGLDGVTYKIEGKQESDIWNRYHKNNPIVDTILKYNTYYVIYKKPSGDPMISAVELSKPKESVEDTAQRFDSFVNQILSVDISGEEVAFPDNAITEKSKKQSGFTIVNLDGSYYSFFIHILILETPTSE